MPRPPSRPLRRALALLALALPAALAAQDSVLVDRIVAVVDDDPILLSDLERAIGLGIVERLPGDTDETLERRALDQLIEHRLRFHEVDRFGFRQVPVSEIEAQVAEIRASFESDEQFHQRLAELDLDPTSLRQLVARQLSILAYVDERLGARIFVDLDDIQAYYEEELRPTMEEQGSPLPPLPEIRESIRYLLRQRRLTAEVERWTAELAAEADILDFLDDDTESVPPLKKRLAQPPEGAAVSGSLPASSPP